MCGRFTLHSRLNLILQQFAIEAGPDIAPRYNIAPTQRVPVIRWDAAHGRRELSLLRWGLIPSWAKDLTIGNRMINARAETLTEKPSFRTAFKRRRCVIPADGYYEWQQTGAAKQPYYLQRADGQLLAMAGLWESWHAGRPDAVESFTIITTDACPETASIHDRMPAMLSSESLPLWLDPEFEDVGVLATFLQPSVDEWQTTPVSTHVNNPRHEDPECVNPLPKA